jgi:hypothetical protein
MGEAPERPIFVTAVCDDCGRIVFSERWRASVRETWPAVGNWWRDQLEQHRVGCSGFNQEAMGLLGGTIPQPLADHLAVALARVDVPAAQPAPAPASEKS